MLRYHSAPKAKDESTSKRKMSGSVQMDSTSQKHTKSPKFKRKNLKFKGRRQFDTDREETFDPFPGEAPVPEETIKKYQRGKRVDFVCAIVFDRIPCFLGPN